MFILLLLLLRCPDITAMVDWAQNTKLLTYFRTYFFSVLHLRLLCPDITAMVDWAQNTKLLT